MPCVKSDKIINNRPTFPVNRVTCFRQPSRSTNEHLIHSDNSIDTLLIDDYIVRLYLYAHTDTWAQQCRRNYYAGAYSDGLIDA